MDIYYLTPPTLQFSTRLTTGEDETAHRHKFFEIFIVLQGRIRHISPTTDAILKAGDGFLIAPDVPHKFRRIGESCTHRDFIISETLMKEACEFINPGMYDTVVQTKYVPMHMSETEMLSLENKSTYFLDDSDVQRRKYFERALTVTLLSNLYVQVDVQSNEFYAKCLEAINEYFQSPDYFSLIQRELGYSKVHLCHKFKEVFGQTMTDYVRERRLRYAAYLLQTSLDAIPQICADVGIESPSYFNRIFRERFGCTPAKYRKGTKYPQVTPPPPGVKLKSKEQVIHRKFSIKKRVSMTLFYYLQTLFDCIEFAVRIVHVKISRKHMGHRDSTVIILKVYSHFTPDTQVIALQALDNLE